MEFLLDEEEKMFHGTTAQFDDFKPSRTGLLGAGVYFADSREVASEWAEGPRGRVIEAVVTLNNPYIYNAQEWAEKYAHLSERRLRRELERQGFDGIIDEGMGVTVAFYPEQIS